MYALNAKHLREFLVLCSTGSVSAAARSLYISPQALSKKIAMMENTLRTPLFKRTRSGLVLTPEGRILEEKAQFILGELKKVTDGAPAQGRIRKVSAGQGEGVEVVLEITNGEINYFGMDQTAAFMAKHPRIRVTLTECSDYGIMRHVENEEVDIGLCAGPIDVTRFTGHYLHSCRHCLVIHKDNPLSKRESLRFADLAGEPLIFNATEYSTYNNNMNRCLRAGFTPNIVFHTQNLENAHLMASLGRGIVISMEDVCEKQNIQANFPNLAVVPFADDEECCNDIFLIRKRDRVLRREVSMLVDEITAYFDGNNNRSTSI